VNSAALDVDLKRSLADFLWGRSVAAGKINSMAMSRVDNIGTHETQKYQNR
jgi:hypothetical protein